MTPAATALVIFAGFAGMIVWAPLRTPPPCGARLLVPAGLAILTTGLLPTAFATVVPAWPSSS